MKNNKSKSGKMVFITEALFNCLLFLS